MKVIQELVAYFSRQRKLTPAQLDKLLKQGLLANDAPDNMIALGAQIGKTFYFRVRGEVRGSVWGTDTYTADSALAAAAVHAGAVALGETGVVKVTVVAPLSQYHGSTRHGIVSHSYGPFRTAFRVESGQ
jgi:hypothetical protein